MAEDWFIWLLFGHLFGDYVFQNSWMALNKSKDWKPLVAHCALYSTIVITFVTIAGVKLGFLGGMLIYLSHIVLDGTNFVKWWCNFYGIRSWDTYLPRVEITNEIDYNAQTTVAETISTSVGVLVYVVIDNTLHLFMMFYIIKYMA